MLLLPPARASDDQAAAAHKNLSADVVGFRRAEQIHPICRLFGRAAPAQGNEDPEGVEELGLNANVDLPALHLDRLLLSLDRLGEPRLDIAERYAIHVDLEIGRATCRERVCPYV